TGWSTAQRLSATGCPTDGGNAALCCEIGDKTGQESRSDDALGVPRMTGMNISIHASFLPHTDPDASLSFYRDTLGFEVRNDVGYEGMRWITVGPVGQPDINIVLDPPAANQGF